VCGGVQGFTSFVTGRRAKFGVVIAWVIVLLALAPLSGKLANVTDTRTETFLPQSAESPTG